MAFNQEYDTVSLRWMNNSTTINVLKVYATAMVYFCHSWIVCYETYDYIVHGLYKLLITPAWAGVWIFLVVGGYLAAHGFYSGKYNLCLGGVASYYKNRLYKILIPTWIFISLGYIFIYQEKTVSTVEFLQWLTCTFNGKGSLPGIGASWYVFIVMWLYFLTPVIIKVVKRVEQKFQGREFKALLVIMGIVIFVGGLYRILTYFFLDWYNWTYANVIGCADLFVAGILVYRITFFLPKLSAYIIIKLRKISIIALVVLTLLCLNFGGLIPLGGWLYKYVWASGYLVVISAILVMYSFQIEGCLDTSIITRSIERSVNAVAPYTFTYYLWHSLILMYVVPKINVVNDNYRFLLSIILGFVVSSYIAFLMTKMNNGIIKTILK